MLHVPALAPGRAPPRRLRTAALTAAALVAFAANSILARMALGSRRIDAVTFTSVRLLAGAFVLAAIVAAARVPASARSTGSLRAAAALFAYAIAFSLAYLRIDAGVGALVLFGAVQVTMLGASLRGGERPRPREWLGLLLALCGLFALTWPGPVAPDLLGMALMLAAGVAWGAYSLLGRGTVHPLAATAGNFLRTVPLALALSLIATSRAHASAAGLLLAVASGAIASGVGYTLWYAALRGLSGTRAAIVQLAVPVLAAGGGVAWLGETLTPRLALSGAAILGGIALALNARR